MPASPELNALIALFTHAEALVEKELLRAIARGAAPSASLVRERNSRLSGIRAILAHLRKETIGTEGSGAAWDLVVAGYREGLRSAHRTTGGDVAPSLGGIHLRAARELYSALTGNLDAAIAHVGRQAEDTLRKVSLQEILVGQLAGRREAANAEAIAENLRSRGVEGFTDRRGRRWSLSDYTSMVAATTAQEANSVATMNRLAEAGIDTVKWMTRPTVGQREPCERCKRLDGKVYSMTGQTEGLPLLEEAPPLHPRCGCILVAHVDMGAAA